MAQTSALPAPIESTPATAAPTTTTSTLGIPAPLDLGPKKSTAVMRW